MSKTTNYTTIDHIANCYINKYMFCLDEAGIIDFKIEKIEKGRSKVLINLNEERMKLVNLGRLLEIETFKRSQK